MMLTVERDCLRLNRAFYSTHESNPMPLIMQSIFCNPEFFLLREGSVKLPMLMCLAYQ